MKLVTLTSDLGLADHYVANLKGMLYSAVKSIEIADVSHLIQPFNIAQAAYCINNCWRVFPKGTVHFLCVDSLPVINIGNPDRNLYPVVMKLNGHYFVGCDNGIFSLIENYQQAETIIRIDFSAAGLELKNANKSIYVPTIQKILAGDSLDKIGEEVNTVRQVFVPQPVVEKNLIKGAVAHVDKYGNAISNITKQLFDSVGQGHPFILYFKNSGYYIDQISDNYNDVPMGEKLALFNENDLLEIAINKGTPGNGGGAATLLGIGERSTLRIEFQPRGSKNSLEELF